MEQSRLQNEIYKATYILHTYYYIVWKWMVECNQPCLICVPFVVIMMHVCSIYLKKLCATFIASVTIMWLLLLAVVSSVINIFFVHSLMNRFRNRKKEKASKWIHSRVVIKVLQDTNRLLLITEIENYFNAFIYTH